MRKFGIVVLVIMMIVVLSACSFFSLFNPTTEGPQHAETLPPGLHIDYKPFMKDSLEAYQEYFSKQDTIPQMVFWEKISQFGEFERYMEDWAGRGKHYEYTMIDSSGYEFILEIEHVEGAQSNEADATFEKGKLETKGDLRKWSGSQRAILELDGFQYKYLINGILQTISWYENGIEFTIRPSDPYSSLLYWYPDTTDTLVGKLLNAETARDAIKTIKAMKITEGLPRGTADASIGPLS